MVPPLVPLSESPSAGGHRYVCITLSPSIGYALGPAEPDGDTARRPIEAITGGQAVPVALSLESAE